MALPSKFQLISTATALAIVPPDHHQPEINSLRKLHDKAFRKWDPHINLLYPFVDPSQLSAAITILRQHVHDTQKQKLQVDMSRVDSFRHRRNATVFLRPSTESEEMICQLRASLATSLGCGENEGTHDGTFRPHMTIGQAGLTGSGIERLAEKVQKLTGVVWDSKSLVVLKREPTGEMKVVDELLFDIDDDHAVSSDKDGYKPCFEFSSSSGWIQRSEVVLVQQHPSTESNMIIASYNIMSEPSAPPCSARLPLIIEAIASTTSSSASCPKVLCLQEVDQEALPLLLADPFIRSTYPFTSHSPISLLPSHRNLVSLSSVPFRSIVIDFEERHKSMMAIRLVDPPLEVINVHLTSGLTDQSVDVKLSQMAKVTEFAKSNTQSKVVVAGDFNCTTSIRTISTALSRNLITGSTSESVNRIIDKDIWQDMYEVFNSDRMNDEFDNSENEDEGSTFDRSANPFAAMQEPPIDRNPQRYDRILFLKGSTIHVENFDRFGLPNKSGKCGSDHYGVCATVSIGTSKGTEPSSNNPSGRTEKEPIIVIEEIRDLLPLISEYLPTEEDRQQREDAIDLLKRTLTNDSSSHDLLLAPLGSYLIDTYFVDSDVDILVIGSGPPSAFFQHASVHLRDLAARDSTGSEFKGVHLVNSLVSIIECTIMGVKFDIQYCQAPELLIRYYAKENTSDLKELAFDTSLISSLSPAALRPFNTYRDTVYIIKTCPELSLFRLAHRFLSLYLKRRGLYSAKFGYLGGIHLSLMLNRVVKLIARAQSSATIIPATIIHTFLEHYASFDWATEVVTDPDLAITPARSAREAVFIHAIHTPTARPNVASSCTRLSTQTFTSDFRLAAEKLEQGDWSWCLRSQGTVIQDFLHGFGAFVKITIDIWDIDEAGGYKIREIFGALESKMTRLLIGLGRLSNIGARVWPARFRVSSDKKAADNNQLQGYYLVGVSAKEEQPDKKRIITSKIMSEIRDFETSIKASKGFQSMTSNVLLRMDLTPKKKILEMSLVLDQRDWGDSIQ